MMIWKTYSLLTICYYLLLATQVFHTWYSNKMWGGAQGEEELEGDIDSFRLPCRDVPEAALSMTLMVVFCTVVVNGLTMAPLMKACSIKYKVSSVNYV